MRINLLITILNLLHLSLYFIILIPCIYNDPKILICYYYFLIFVYLGWILFKDNCWLSIIEQNIYKKYKMKKNKNQLINYLKDYFKIDVSKNPNIVNLFYHIINYSSFLLLTYKLKKIHIGIGWIVFYEIYKKSVFVK